MEYADFGATRQAGYTANGIRVVVYTIPHRPITMVAGFDAGNRYDPAGRECLAHATEHMLVAGTEAFPSKDKIAAYIEQLGGSIGASTYPSSLIVRLTIGYARNLAPAVYLLNQLLVYSSYDEFVFENERESMRQELASLQGSPSAYVERLFYGQLLSNTIMDGKITDKEPAIDAVGIDEIRHYAQQRLVGGNMVIVLAGDITLEGAVAHLDQQLELSSEYSALVMPPPVVYGALENRIIARPYDSSKQVRLSYGFASYSMDHPDAAALDVLTQILGGGRASSLSRLLRYENGLVYSVRASSMNDFGFGTWKINTGTKPHQVENVIELINGELSRATNGGITHSELAQAKATLINSLPVKLDSVGSFLGFHVEQDLYDLPEFTRAPGWANAIYNVTLNDIVRVAQDIFRPETSVLALCGVPAYIEESILY